MDLGFARRDEGASGTSYTGLKRLPCANVGDRKAANEHCTKDGLASCGACGLVSYCSIRCQKLHWSTHKKDCQNPMRSKDWLPGWIRDSRVPYFIQHPETNILDPKQAETNFKYTSPLSRLWGRMAPCDVLNVPREHLSSEVSIMFAASGDLRDVLQTVNRLPNDFTGNISISINDPDPYIASRALLSLAVLGTIDDLDKAADIATHLWYSVRLPSNYSQAITHIARKEFILKLFPKTATSTLTLSPSSRLIWKKHGVLMGALANVGVYQLEIDKVKQEINDALFEEKRRDLAEKHLASLDPSHRVAFTALRRSGVLLPFGADSSAFTHPNPTLFGADGRWLQDDAFYPLAGWNVDEVLTTGKAHGAHRSDLFGCLYFHLCNELRKFADRIRRFNITFRVLNVDAHDLAIGIPTGHYEDFGLSSRTRFDRIHTSNLMDANYSGLGAVLKDWTPLLNPLSVPRATILGYFLNWAHSMPAASLQTRHHRETSAIITQADDRGWLPKPTNISTQDFLYIADPCLEALHDNSGIFLLYLEYHKLSKLCRELGLRHRERNAIAVHRKGVPLGVLNTENPTFSNRKSFYRQVQLSYWTGYERYVEICMD